MDEFDFAIIRSMANNRMMISRVSKELYTHRNTVTYRLEHIKSRTGLDPKDFYDLVKLLKRYREEIDDVRVKEL